MVLRVLALAAFVSVVGVGCGGGELPEADGSESGSLPQQNTAALVSSCEAIQGRFCSPETETVCVYANGTPGECYCQDKPFNDWVCWPAS